MRRKIRGILLVMLLSTPLLLVLSLTFFTLFLHTDDLTLDTLYLKNESSVYINPLPIHGMVSSPSAKVTINGIPVVVSKNGHFIGAADLNKGQNIIIISAINRNLTKNKMLFVNYS